MRAISMKIATENPKMAFLLIKWTYEEYRTIRHSTRFSLQVQTKKPLFVHTEQCCTHVTLCKVYSLFMISSWWGLDETQRWNKLYVYNRNYYNLFITLSAYITCFTDLFLSFVCFILYNNFMPQWIHLIEKRDFVVSFVCVSLCVPHRNISVKSFKISISFN